MTKDELERIKISGQQHPYCKTTVIASLVETVEQAWAERDEDHLTITRLADQRDRLVQLNNDLVEGMSVHRTIISNLQQQNTELLEDVAALRQERDVLKAEVEKVAADSITDSNLSYDIGRRHKQEELQPTLDTLKTKLELLEVVNHNLGKDITLLSQDCSLLRAKLLAVQGIPR